MKMLSAGQMECDSQSILQTDEVKTTNSINLVYDNFKMVFPSLDEEVNQEQQQAKISEQDQELANQIKNPLIKKSIAKLYKSQSKKFQKKQIMILPNCPMVREISQNHIIILFGCLEVETYYKDYQDPYDRNLILYIERMHVADRVTKDLELNLVDILQSPLSHSGIADFDFLIDRFIKMQNQDYLEIAKELSVYQYIVRNHLIPQMSKQKNRILKNQKKKEDFYNAQKEFVGYFKDYIRREHDSSSFYDYELYSSNFMTGEIELFQSGFSISLASLLGVEQDQIENLVFRGQKYYNEQNGDFRLKLFLFLIKALNNEIEVSDPFPFILRTYDGIVINCSAAIEYVSFKGDSKWIDKDDMYGIIIRFDVNVNQIKAILEIRSHQTNQDIEINNCSYANNVEYQMYQEIFLEKFYPNQFINKNIKDQEQRNLESTSSTNKHKIYRKAVTIN